MILQRSFGILAHPTSFPSPYGIGDLGKGAYDFVDLLSESKATIWQVLPLGHTSFGDSPYQSFSTFAGNPLLISPDILLKENLLKQDDLKEIPCLELDSVDYGTVIKYKNTLYKKAYENSKTLFSKEQKDYFRKFCNKSSFWLEDYALFVALKNHFIEERRNTFESKEYLEYKKLNEKFISENSIKDNFYGAVWNSWDEDIKNRTPAALKKWRYELIEEINYYKFIQYMFFKQWKRLKKNANKKNISIIGDIPIFVAMDSADVWSNPELYYLDLKGYPTKVAGVPPDYFSKTGQLWGNPLYNWEKHKQSGYDWWIKRISATLSCVDILRIDHFRGFDEYWAVPYGEKTAIKGKWEKGPGKDLFRVVEKALGELPIIAEDLGLITESVKKLRVSLQFPGMKILQFAFDDPSNDYIPHNIDTTNTVIYTGTHDNDTTVGWYEKLDDKVKDYFRRYLNVSGEDPAWDLIRLALSSVAALAIIPIQDIMNLDSKSRMNTPGVAENNWKFRFTKDMFTEEMVKGLLYLATLFNRIPKLEDKEIEK